MSKAPQEGDKAVLAALDGIVRMQRTIRGGLDVCVNTGLVFVRTYYNNLPESIARRLTELNPVALAAIPGATSVPGQREGPEEHHLKRGERRGLCPGHPGSEHLPQEAGPRPPGGRRQTRADGRRQQQ